MTLAFPDECLCRHRVLRAVQLLSKLTARGGVGVADLQAMQVSRDTQLETKLKTSSFASSAQTRRLYG